MLQFPAYMTQYPLSTSTIPTSFLLPSQWPQPQNAELLIDMEECDFEEKHYENTKRNSNLIVIGKTTNDEDDSDNGEESEGEEFEQENG